MERKTQTNMKKLFYFIFFITIFVSCERVNDGNDKDELLTCSITSPANLEIISNNTEFELTAITSTIVQKVEFYLDGISIGSVISEPYSIKWTPENIDAGIHKLKCIAIPTQGDNAEDEIEIILELRLGDEFKGGKIFYIDENKGHGLIAALNDISVDSRNKFFWGTHDLIGASDKNDGKSNTSIMANSVTSSNYAGYAFKNGYYLKGYDDWFIPAQEQLKILKENQDYVGGFSTSSDDAKYWSSTELSSDIAYALNFAALMGTNVTKGLYGYRIRPIREF
jgi:hypothetical protein